MTYSFGPFQLDAPSRRLRRGSAVVVIPDRQVDVLLQLLARAGQVVSKDALIAAAWHDVAVTDNSLEQAVSALRRTLGTPEGDAKSYIETLARRGYRFAVPVTVTPSRHSDEALAALLAPYRALADGRAALETLDREAVARACRVFEEMVAASPDYAPAHLGLANAFALAGESVRAESGSDASAHDRALHHAAEACRLEPASGEAWATLSVLCHQSRDHARATAAAQRAAALEPDNWRHHLRLAYVSGGEARLRAAHRVLKLLPDFPFAHWLAASVHVARQAFDQAEHELRAGAAAQDRQPDDAPFKGVGLHLLLGLVQLATGNEDGAIQQFERELTFKAANHIYGREAGANAWCALAAVHLRHARRADADAALARAIDAVGGHVVAVAARAALSHDETARAELTTRLAELRTRGAHVEAAVAEGVAATLAGAPADAVRVVHAELERASGGGVGWSIPVEPFLDVRSHYVHWQPVLTLLRSRSA
jgi:DNA-binding winged helix-turn-helix (wHTH) protein